MKKLFAILLILATLFTAVGCDDGTESTFSMDDSALSDITDISAESVVLDEFKLSEDVAKIDSYLTNDIDRSLLATNVFRGVKYDFSRPTDPAYPEHSLKLTNGDSTDSFDANSYIGWKERLPVAIDFDLGESKHNIADITVGCLRVVDYGIGLPEYVSIHVSNDGKDYTEIGKIVTPKNIPDAMKYEYSFAFPKGTSARYFRVYCSKPDHAFTFIDEIAAYDYNASGTIDRNTGEKVEQNLTINDFYSYNLNLGESKVKVSKDDADYNKEQNLARLEGVDFQIFHFDPLRADHSNSPKSRISLLNNGRLHGNHNADYFINQRGGGRHIVCDLGHIMAVSGATFSFYDRYTWGVSTPPAYYVSVSENGKDWTTVYSAYNENYGKTEKIEDTHNIKFADSYKARYVRLTFATTPNNAISSSVYLGEFEVIGKKNPDGAVKAVEDDSPYGKYVSTEKYGIENLLFAPITDGYGKHCTDVHVMSEENAYTYLATFDENGKANGVFMDSVAFSTRGGLNDHKDRNEGMKWFFDELFYEGVNLDAVDKAKGKLNHELGTNDKIKIWVSINAPAKNDIFNGETVTTIEQSNACVKWQIDETLRRYNEKDYKNLEFVGFYWQFESVRTESDIDTMIYMNDYVHDMGYLTFWCPYYTANGIWLNHQVGFDIACLQPNYMFYDTEPTRTDTTAELAKLYGMCVEIEIEGGVISDEVLELYRAYLKSGYEKGYMNSVKVYYQGGLPGAYIQGHRKGNENDKAMYEETILYATEKLNADHYVTVANGLDKFTDKELTVKHGKSAEINVGDLTAYKYRYTTTPAYGSVRLDENGTLVYTAMKGYEGEDVIKIVIYDGEFGSKEITVKVTVTK